MDQYLLWSIWFGLLLDYFQRSETNLDISQINQNLILTSVWVSKNSSSDIIILGEYHFSNFDFYTYSPTLTPRKYSLCLGSCSNQELQGISTYLYVGSSWRMFLVVLCIGCIIWYTTATKRNSNTTADAQKSCQFPTKPHGTSSSVSILSRWYWWGGRER